MTRKTYTREPLTTPFIRGFALARLAADARPTGGRMTPERIAYLRAEAEGASEDHGAATDWGAPTREALDEVERLQQELERLGGRTTAQPPPPASPPAGGPLTVAALVERLQAMPPYAPVMMDASDAETAVQSVELGTCYSCPAVLVRLSWRRA